MNKAMTNYWVDMVTGAAFLFCAVTGLIRLFPRGDREHVKCRPAGHPRHQHERVADRARLERRDHGRRRRRTHGAAPALAGRHDRQDGARQSSARASAPQGAGGAGRRSTRKGFLAAVSVLGAAAIVTSQSLVRRTEVVIDAGACTGCGRCVLICPYGVFTMSGGKAIVQNGAACRLCAKCTRRCIPEAITLNP
jgi:ferredoxin